MDSNHSWTVQNVAAKVTALVRWQKDQWKAEEFKLIPIQWLKLWQIISMIYLQATKNAILWIQFYLVTFYSISIIDFMICNNLKKTCPKQRNKFQICKSLIINWYTKNSHPRATLWFVDKRFQRMTDGFPSPELQFRPSLRLKSSPKPWNISSQSPGDSLPERISLLATMLYSWISCPLNSTGILSV